MGADSQQYVTSVVVNYVFRLASNIVGHCRPVGQMPCWLLSGKVAKYMVAVK